ncbi:paeninodin family lasso peptide [Virgibacillus phasianinus]|nr:paeninodin family lasso peptide [Virgibacillus phasianinus]
MKGKWKKPVLESLNVKQTMNWDWWDQFEHWWEENCNPGGGSLGDS